MTGRLLTAHPLRIRRPGMRATLPAGAKLVTHGSRWGNRFWDPKRHPERTRAEAVALYRQWLLGNEELLAQLPDLGGRQLACYCPLDEPCHADVLARLANREPATSPIPRVALTRDEATTT